MLNTPSQLEFDARALKNLTDRSLYPEIQVATTNRSLCIGLACSAGVPSRRGN